MGEDIKKTMTLTIAKKLKQWEINLTKDTQHPYTENYKNLLWWIEEDVNKWRDTLYPLLIKWSTVHTKMPRT